MICYRIYTEEKEVISYDLVEWLQDLGIDGATVSYTSGVWKGAVESSMVIEILLPSLDGRIIELAEKIRTEGNQEAVLITRHEVAGFMLTGYGLEVL